MKNRSIKYLLLLLFCNTITAQNFNSGFDISASFNYTTTSKMFLNPNSPDGIIRTLYTELKDINSYSIEFRCFFSKSVAIGLSAESMEKTDKGGTINLGGLRAILKDGYQFTPVELSVYYYLPFSTERFIFFMGGGAGLYFGKHIRSLGNVAVSSSLKKLSTGIHVSVGMEYMIWNFISVRGQMRFRDPEFELNNTYSDKIVNYEGQAFVLSTDSFSTKINVDGITFTIGIVLRF